MDVEEYLKSIRLNNFKSGNNIKVFSAMSRDDWESADTRHEISNFINTVYDKIS